MQTLRTCLNMSGLVVRIWRDIVLSFCCINFCVQRYTKTLKPANVRFYIMYVFIYCCFVISILSRYLYRR